MIQTLLLNFIENNWAIFKMSSNLKIKCCCGRSLQIIDMKQEKNASDTFTNTIVVDQCSCTRLKNNPWDDE